MKGQFDPDVWGALLLIVAVGFGGILMIDLIVGSTVFHAMLQLLDTEYSQSSIYVISPLTLNTYGYDTNKPSSIFSNTEKFYQCGAKKKISQFENLSNEINESVYAFPFCYENKKVVGFCSFIVNENKFSSEYISKRCGLNSDQEIVLSYNTPLYTPYGSSVAYIGFIADKNEKCNVW